MIDSYISRMVDSFLNVAKRFHKKLDKALFATCENNGSALWGFQPVNIKCKKNIVAHMEAFLVCLLHVKANYGPVRPE